MKEQETRRNRNEEKSQAGTTETVELCAAPSLLDRLKIKRTNFARESNLKLKRFDRQIELLERSDAEEIVKESERILFQED